MLFFVAIACFITCGSSAVMRDGPCPNVKPVDNFNITAFHQGRWYEIAKYSNEFEGKKDCVYVDHYIENGRKKVKFYELDENKKFVFFYSFVELNPKAGNTGLVDYFSRNITGPEGEDEAAAFTLTFLSADYDNCIIVYRCVNNEDLNKHHDFAWIGSRTKILDDKNKETAENFIKATGFLDLDLFVWDHFEMDACKAI